VLLAVLAAGCGPGEPPPPAAGRGGPPDAVSATIVDRTNADRVSRGLGPLAWDARLGALAAEWAQYLADTRQLRHRDLAATIASPGFEGYTALGENLLAGPGGITGDRVQDAWLASPAHAANVVGAYDVIGVAVAHGADGNARVVADYGRGG
jgi:uncharacterized protein YkwD